MPELVKLSADELYDKVRLAQVSQNCLAAAEDYFKIIVPLCPVREDAAHSLLRIAMRPLYYMGVCKFAEILTEIEYLGRNNPSFLKWISDNKDMSALVLTELQICGRIHLFDYDNVRDIVILKPFDTTWLDEEKGIYKELASFDDFKIYFCSLFVGYEILPEEIDRIILEEGYEKRYYDCITAPVRTRYSPNWEYRYEVTKRKGGLFQISVQRRVDDIYYQGWEKLTNDYVHITDTCERAEEIGDELLRNLSGTLLKNCLQKIKGIVRK